MKLAAGGWMLQCWRGCLRELARCLVAAPCAGCGGVARGGAGPRWPPVMPRVEGGGGGPVAGPPLAPSQLCGRAEDRVQHGRVVQVACSCLHHRQVTTTSHSVTLCHIVSHKHCHTVTQHIVTQILSHKYCHTNITLSHKYCHTAGCYTNTNITTRCHTNIVTQRV